MDLVWSVLVLLGIEKLRIVPGFTEANALDLYYMPYTHGLPGSIVLSLLLGAIVALFTSGNRAMTVLLVAAASFSHWVLDLSGHREGVPKDASRLVYPGPFSLCLWGNRSLHGRCFVAVA